MDPVFKPSDFVVPPTTSAVLLPSSWLPSFVQSSTKFQRAAFDPDRTSVVVERLDPKDEPDVFNYNEYRVLLTCTGTLLSGPLPAHDLHPSPPG